MDRLVWDFSGAAATLELELSLSVPELVLSVLRVLLLGLGLIVFVLDILSSMSFVLKPALFLLASSSSTASDSQHAYWSFPVVSVSCR